MTHLAIVEAGQAERRVPLDADSCLIGRDPAGQVVLNDNKTSRRHARIYRQDEQIWAEDLGSANGSLLDGMPLQHPTPMANQAILQVGNTTIQLLKSPGDPSQVRFRLHGQHAAVKQRSFDVGDILFEVGRGNSNALVVEHASISRRHATLRVVQGGLEVEDLDSANGTFIGDSRVRRQLAQHGDRIRFGEVAFRLEDMQASVRGLAHQASLQVGQRLMRLKGLALIILILAVLAGVGMLYKNRLSASSNAVTARRLLLQRSEGALQVQVEAAQAAGDAALKAQSWTQAAAAFRHALELDPAYAPARAGLDQAELRAQALAATLAALAALQQQQPMAALVHLWRIEAAGADVDPSLAQAAHQQLAEDALQRALQACRDLKWSACQLQAALALLQQPRQVQPLALLLEAEAMLQQEHRPYVPYVAGAASTSLGRRHPDLEVREAVMRYASGEIPTALKRLETFRRRLGARAAMDLILGSERARAGGNRAAAQHDMGGAVAQWNMALQLDARLIPNDYASAPAQAIRQVLTAEYLRQGTASYDRGSYDEAYGHFNRGLHIDAAEPALLAAMGRLELRAAAFLEEVAPAERPAAAACQRLREILSMTRATSPAHKGALVRIRSCKP